MVATGSEMRASATKLVDKRRTVWRIEVTLIVIFKVLCEVVIDGTIDSSGRWMI